MMPLRFRPGSSAVNAIRPVAPGQHASLQAAPWLLAVALFALGAATATAMPEEEARALAADPARILLQAASFDTREGPAASLPADLTGQRSDGPDYVIVQFRDPLGGAQRQRIEELGGEVLEYIPNRAYLTRITPEVEATLAAADDVRWTGLYHPAYRLSPEIGTRVFTDPARRTDDHLWLSVDVFDGEDLAAVAARIGALGAEVMAVHDSELVRRLHVRALPDLLDDVARIRAVQWIEEWGEFTLRNNITRWVVQSNQIDVTSIWDHGIHGEGQIVGHIDSRIHRDSCFFIDPVDNTPGPAHRKLVSYRSSSGYGQGSHGTHTAGTIAGDQEPINGTREHNGIAYAARIAHANLSDITGFGNTPSNFAEYLGLASGDGARVHTNSWGDDGTTAYTTWARDIDVFSREFEDDLVGFAVTNLSTLRTPENAKNVLAIGSTYQAPSQHQHHSGGRGPTADGRRKPEIKAPGRGIVSARTFSSCSTTSSSGTSMACPAVMGSGALVRQYFEGGWYTGELPGATGALTPTAALVKATLLNATVDMNPAGYPTDIEGWGRLLLDDALYFEGDVRDLRVWDIRHAGGLATGESAELHFTVASSAEPLRVTLVFTDEPAALGASFTPVNDLDLELTGPFSSYKGNVLSEGWSVPGGDFDPLNNVEMVLLEAPAAVRYTIRVAARQVAGPELQGYAVVVTGDLGGATTAVSQPSPAAASRLVAVRPNPFNPSASVELELPAASRVHLGVYDPAGRRVRSLIDGLLAGGRHRARWDGRNDRGGPAASGIYLFRLEVDGREADVTKAVLLR